MIRAAQRVGLGPGEIADAITSLPTHHAPTKAGWSRLSRSWRPRVDEQIALLKRLRDQLDNCIGCRCLSPRTCQLAYPGDAARTHGPGAGFLS